MKILLVIVAMLALTTETAAEGAGGWAVEILFDGAERAAGRKIAGLATGRRYSISEINTALKRLYAHYAAAGFPLARLDSVEVHSDRLKLFVSPGQPLMGRLEPDDSDSLIVADARARIITEALLEEEAFAILDQLTDEGFPFATVTFKPTIGESGGELKGVFHPLVERGPFMRIGSIKFPGRVQTKARILTLESRLRRGDPVRRSELMRAVERLGRLEYIAGAGPEQIAAAAPGIATVLIPVQESPANRISGVAAVSPQDDRPTGSVNFLLANILGTGRRLGFIWEGLNPHRRGVRIDYREPYLLGRPAALAGQFQLWREDSLGEWSRLGGQLEWEVRDRITAIGGVAAERLKRHLEAVAGAIEANTLWLEGAIESDRRDRAWNPDAGAWLRLEGAWGRRRGTADNAGEMNRRGFTIEAVAPIAEKWRLFVRGTETELSGVALQPEELPRVGGSNSVRGYLEDFRRGRGVAAGTIELRWRPNKMGFLGVFADAGDVFHPDNDWPTDRSLLVSSGISGGWQSPAGQISLAVALARGAPFDRARLHLKIESKF